MTQQTLGLLIGGLVPALCYGMSNLLVKFSNNAGIGTGPYLISIGIAVAIVGIISLFVFPDHTVSLRSGSYAFVLGLIWGLGTAAVAIGVARYGAPMSKVVPIFNLNTLITVLLALWIFAEWKEVRVPQLLIGSVLMVAGGVLVSKA